MSELYTVTLTICGLCMGGAGGWCHIPGCVFSGCPAPTEGQADRITDAWIAQRGALAGQENPNG